MKLEPFLEQNARVLVETGLARAQNTVLTLALAKQRRRHHLVEERETRLRFAFARVIALREADSLRGQPSRVPAAPPCLIYCDT